MFRTWPFFSAGLESYGAIAGWLPNHNYVKSGPHFILDCRSGNTMQLQHAVLCALYVPEERNLESALRAAGKYLQHQDSTLAARPGNSSDTVSVAYAGPQRMTPRPQRKAKATSRRCPRFAPFNRFDQRTSISVSPCLFAT